MRRGLSEGRLLECRPESCLLLQEGSTMTQELGTSHAAVLYDLQAKFVLALQAGNPSWWECGIPQREQCHLTGMALQQAFRRSQNNKIAWHKPSFTLISWAHMHQCCMAPGHICACSAGRQPYTVCGCNSQMEQCRVTGMALPGIQQALRCSQTKVAWHQPPSLLIAGSSNLGQPACSRPP